MLKLCIYVVFSAIVVIMSCMSFLTVLLHIPRRYCMYGDVIAYYVAILHRVLVLPPDILSIATDFSEVHD